MKYLVWILIFFLPFHALIITYLKCKVWINVDILRFWKEIILIVLLFISLFSLLKKNKFSFKKIYRNNYLLGVLTSFIICSFIFIFFPFFNPELYHFLWFKYDVFFLFALIIWLYLPNIKNNLPLFLKISFFSTFIILIIFLPWYLFWDIGNLSTIFWYSDKVSTYNAWSCISFAQNVNWQHRFQWTFWWPIRFSVYLTIFYIIFIWFILNIKGMMFKKSLIWFVSVFVILSIFFSFSKTSILWLLFWIIAFVYFSRKVIYKKDISKKFLIYSWVTFSLPIILIAIFKKDLFLHLGAILNRLENLSKSLEMFFYNPIWHWLGIAWPASQIWKSIESAWSWQIATANTNVTHRFLPENWYIQILLEQWIVGLVLFISLLSIIWFRLYKKMKYKKDFFSVGIFVWFITLCFMANFTHAFEESATSYVLFLLIWVYLSKKK